MTPVSCAGLLWLGAAIGCYPQFDVQTRGRAAEHGVAEPSMSDGAGGTAGEPATGGAGEAGVAGQVDNERTCVRGEAILVGHVTNARDLGGLPVSGGAVVACGAIYRGGPLKALTAPGCKEVAALGLGTVIDLRTDTERASTPNSSCVTAARLPAPLPIPYALSGADYLRDLHEVSSIATAFHAFGDPSAYPIYFHCTYGRDRTGVVGALLLLALGATPEDVMADYMLSADSVGAYPESLQAVLDEIQARGGAEAVLGAAGITAAEIAVLRSHALAASQRPSSI